MFKKALLVLSLLLLLAACVPTPEPGTEIVVPPATEVPTQAPTEAPPEQAEVCPSATADLKLLVSTEHGFCLLYPAEFTWDGARLIVLNPNGAAGDVPGEAWLLVSISDAGGQTAAQLADARSAEIGQGFEIARTEVTIGGQPAIVVDGLPGQDSNRLVFIVNNDRLYMLAFEPWSAQDGASSLEKLYQAVVDSIRFLPTSAAITAAEKECPAETGTLKLLVNIADGYCLLYPDGLGLLPPRLIVINPNPMPGDVLGDAWLDVVINNAEGQTAAQIADAKIAEAGEGFNITRTELTIDGKQAILVDGLPGQDSMRTVFIVNRDMLYRFQFMPWYPNNGSTPLENLYQTVMDSLHFLP